MQPKYISYRGYVYLIKAIGHNWVKIGMSTNATVRLKNLGILLPFEIEVVAMWRTNSPRDAERFMHEKFSEFRINGEWFSIPEKKLNDASVVQYELDWIYMHLIDGKDLASLTGGDEGLITRRQLLLRQDREKKLAFGKALKQARDEARSEYPGNPILARVVAKKAREEVLKSFNVGKFSPQVMERREKLMNTIDSNYLHVSHLQLVV